MKENTQRKAGERWKKIAKVFADQKESQMFDYVCLFGFVVSASRLDEALAFIHSWSGNELSVE